MKRISYIAILALTIVACGALYPSAIPTVSQDVIQTAIAQTQAASNPVRSGQQQPNHPNPPAPTNAPIPTSIPLPTPTTSFGTLVNPFPYNMPTHISMSTDGNTMYFILSIGQTIRGSSALSLIQQANRFNGAPPTGMEAILIQLTISDVTGSGTLSLNDNDFAVVSNGRMTKSMDYMVCCMNELRMDELQNITLLAGGTATGWIASLETTGDQNTLLVFDPKLILDMNTATSSLYFALPPSSK